MGIGANLLLTFMFAAAVAIAAIFGLRRSGRIKRRWLRAIFVTAFCALLPIGILPFGGNLLLALRPQTSIDPIEALAEIFQKPLPLKIQAVNGARWRSSDYWSLYLAIKLEPAEVETLRKSRDLSSPSSMAHITFDLPTNVTSPVFWPRQNCEDMMLFKQVTPTFEKLPPPGTWKAVWMFYCPHQSTAFIWAVDVD